MDEQTKTVAKSVYELVHNGFLRSITEDEAQMIAQIIIILETGNVTINCAIKLLQETEEIIPLLSKLMLPIS